VNETLCDQDTLEQLDLSGLFDAAWYLIENPDVRSAGLDPLSHFCGEGWRERRKPNPYFDPTWYLDQYPDVRAAVMNPLLHYLRHGDREGRRPIRHFDPAWYRSALPGPANVRSVRTQPGALVGAAPCALQRRRDDGR
jgi:hypothetical protein